MPLPKKKWLQRLSQRLQESDPSQETILTTVRRSSRPKDEELEERGGNAEPNLTKYEHERSQAWPRPVSFKPNQSLPGVQPVKKRKQEPASLDTPAGLVEMRTMKLEKDISREIYGWWSTKNCHDPVSQVFLSNGNCGNKMISKGGTVFVF